MVVVEERGLHLAQKELAVLVVEAMGELGIPIQGLLFKVEAMELLIQAVEAALVMQEDQVL